MRMRNKMKLPFFFKTSLLKLFAAMHLLAALIMLAPQAHAEEALKWVCTPEAGKPVHVGDTLSYTLFVGPSGVVDAWVALRIKLGKGMRLIQESVVISPNELSEELSVPVTLESEAENAALERELVLGNEGFVVLSEKLCEGDAFSFSAVVDAPDAEVFALAQTDRHKSDISHILDTSQVNEQAERVFSEDKHFNPQVQQKQGSKTTLWGGLALCFALTGLIGLRLYKQWLPWFKKTFAKSK